MRGEKNYQISEKNLTIEEKKQDETEMHKDARLLGKNWKKNTVNCCQSSLLYSPVTCQ